MWRKKIERAVSFNPRCFRNHSELLIVPLSIPSIISERAQNIQFVLGRVDRADSVFVNPKSVTFSNICPIERAPFSRFGRSDASFSFFVHFVSR
jgi:hypothetical protein